MSAKPFPKSGTGGKTYPMLDTLGRFASALVMGEGKEALDVLGEDYAPMVADEALPETTAEPGTGCGKRDGEHVCLSHGEDGSCIMGKVTAK